MDRRNADLLLALATVAALGVVPSWSLRYLTDPSYWGVIGFSALVLWLLLRGPGRSWRAGSSNRRTILLFLAAVPVVYVADWLRFGGSGLELGVELGGLACWFFLTGFARRSDTVLWLGCALHGLWDALHFGRVDFVPEWYAAACLAADIGLAAFVLLRLRQESLAASTADGANFMGPQ